MTMVKIVVECLKSNQGEITTLSREGVTNISFEGKSVLQAQFRMSHHCAPVGQTEAQASGRSGKS